MRALPCLLVAVLLLNLSGAAVAEESQALTQWPSAVTTLIISAKGGATFMCNASHGKGCNFVILDAPCKTSANSSGIHLGQCNPGKLVQFHVELGKSKEVDASLSGITYCASGTQPVLIPSCLQHAKILTLPRSAGDKSTSL
jgi:hypothetical protein